jgi:uncharacterized protein YkvS
MGRTQNINSFGYFILGRFYFLGGVYMKKNKPQPIKKANIDDIIEFTRHGEKIIGKVITLRPETVIVEILDKEQSQRLEYGNDRTVVRDGRYVIKIKSSLPQQPIDLGYTFNGWQRNVQ